MKKSLIAGIIALGCLTVNNVDLNAQRTNDRTNKVHQLEKKGDRSERVKEKTDKLIEELNLNKAQVKKLRAINKDYGNQVRTIREGKMPRETQMKQIKALRKEHNSQIKGILNKKQLIKYEQMLEVRKAKKAERKGNARGQKERMNTERMNRNNSRSGNLRSADSVAKSQGRSVQKGKSSKNMAIKRTARLSNALDLNSSQEAQVLDIHKTAAEKIRALSPEVEPLTRSKRMKELHKIENETNDAIRKVLNTKEQRTKFDAYVEKIKASRAVKRKESKPMSPHRPY